MKVEWRLLGLASFVLLLTSAPISVRAAEGEVSPEPGALLEEMKAAIEPPRPSIRKIDIVLRDSQGARREWTARQLRKRTNRGNEMVMVMITPPEVHGTALLVREQVGKPDAQWIYLPALRRVRKIVPVGAFQNFLGTDFTYADLGFVDLERRSLAYLGIDSLDGRSAYKVQEIPADQWYYSRIVDWIELDTKLPLQRDFYAVSGPLWKTQRFETVTVVQDVPTPLVVRIEDHTDGGSTELRVDRVRYDEQLPDEVFDPAALPKLVDHAIWSAGEK